MGDERISKKLMAATTLRPDGWSGATKGVWTNRANVVVNEQGGVQTRGSQLIDTLGGDDWIRGERSKGSGIELRRDPRRSNLQLGKGADTVTGVSGDGDGISNRGFLYAGPGNDRITGIGGKGGLALHNRGFVFTQAGRDVLDAGKGGIRGGGFADLGADDDTFLGFGDHLIYGGGGRDLLLLPKGDYTLRRRNSNRYDLEKGNKRLELTDFEVIGSIDGRKDDQLKVDKSGNLTIKKDGAIVFT